MSGKTDVVKDRVKNSGQSESLWMATATGSQRTEMAVNTHADVCIVGAGIAGITT